MKIGIYFTAAHKSGGVYQYSLAFLKALAAIPGHEYVIITTSAEIPEQFFRDPRFQVVNLAGGLQAAFEARRNFLANELGKVVSVAMNMIYRLNAFYLIELLMRFSQRDVLRTIRALKLDLLIFPAGTDLSYIVDVPTVVAVHDLQHRLNPQFPEVSAGGRYEYRENYYSKACARSVRILVDSHIGKEDVIACYPEVPQDKVISLPFLPPPYLNPRMTAAKAEDLLKKYNIKSPFVFYPAQFWPHKNHLRLVQAIKNLHEKGQNITLVLTGSTSVDFSTYSEIVAFAKKSGIRKYVKYLGYVDNDVVSALYKKAEALIMPTFFGPTNIPILEAWLMGTPVITSDIRGCKDQLGSAGLLADPFSSYSISQALAKVLNDKNLRRSIIEAGHRRIKEWTYSDFSKIVEDMIKSIEYGNKRNKT